MRCIIFIATVVAALALQTTGATIGIDSRNGDGAFNLATGANFSDFRTTIGQLGYTQAFRNSFTAANLTGLDALILKQPPSTATNFTSAEISAIQGFVNSGHGLLILAEAGNSSNLTLANLNSLTAPYGVLFDPAVMHGEGFTVGDFVPHPVTAGLNFIGLDFYRFMSSISPPAIDLTLLGGDYDVLAAVNGVGGKGNVVLLGDSSLWTGPGLGSDRPITFEDNRRLLENTLAFITTVPEPGVLLIAVGAGLLLRQGRSRRAMN